MWSTLVILPLIFALPSNACPHIVLAVANLVAVAILSEAVNAASSLVLSAADITPAVVVVALLITTVSVLAEPFTGFFLDKVIVAALASVTAPVPPVT